MIKPKFGATMQGGKLVMTDQEAFDLYLQKFKDETEMDVVVGRKYTRRTQGAPGEKTNFNGYWWAVIIRMISDAMGEIDDDYTHNMIQLEIGNFRETKDGIRVPAGTKDKSGGEFAELCSKARVWASQNLNLSIPEPNEAEWTY